MFTTPCFIKKHSKKLENKLLEFGYNEFIFSSKEFIAVPLSSIEEIIIYFLHNYHDELIQLIAWQ